MNSRTKARLRAVEVLFEADQRQEDIIDVLKRRRLHTAAQISAYAEEIVRGVREHDDEIREYLETYARDWSFVESTRAKPVASEIATASGTSSL